MEDHPRTRALARTAATVGVCGASLALGLGVAAAFASGRQAPALTASRAPAGQAKAACQSTPAPPKAPAGAPSVQGSGKVAGDGGYVAVSGSSSKGLEICYALPKAPSGLPAPPPLPALPAVGAVPALGHGAAAPKPTCQSTPAPPPAPPGTPTARGSGKVSGGGGSLSVEGSSSKGVRICGVPPQAPGGLPAPPPLPVTPAGHRSTATKATCQGTPAPPPAPPGTPTVQGSGKVAGGGGSLSVEGSSSKGVTVCYVIPKAPAPALPSLPSGPGVPGL